MDTMPDPEAMDRIRMAGLTVPASSASKNVSRARPA
jgi:hypothetical protein